MQMNQMNYQQDTNLDTILFYNYDKKWVEVSQISGEFNRRLNGKIIIEAIEMISPTEGLLKFQDAQQCKMAFDIFQQRPDGIHYEFSSSKYFVDLSLARKMAPGKFVCNKTSLDLSCVPVEYLIDVDL